MGLKDSLALSSRSDKARIDSLEDKGPEQGVEEDAEGHVSDDSFESVFDLILGLSLRIEVKDGGEWVLVPVGLLR